MDAKIRRKPARDGTADFNLSVTVQPDGSIRGIVPGKLVKVVRTDKGREAVAEARRKLLWEVIRHAER